MSPNEDLLGHFATAPGKMMVSGEYAVLDGAPAIVAAVQARATARLITAESLGTTLPDLSRFAFEGDAASGGTTGRYPEAAVARRLAEAELGPTEGDLMLDVTALRRGDVKLGLGSSAAAAAAGAGAVFVAHGRSVRDHEAEIFSAALRGHAAVAPQGSGADVAAAVYGGFLEYRLPDMNDPKSIASAARKLVWPSTLQLRIAWTGQAASTRDLVEQVRAFQTRDAAGYQKVMKRLVQESGRFVACVGQGADAVVQAAERYHQAMAALGEAAGAPIVEERLTEIARLAADAGGSAKPSGAGGGDVALAFFASRTGAKAFEAACARANITVLDLPLGGEGVAG